MSLTIFLKGIFETNKISDSNVRARPKMKRIATYLGKIDSMQLSAVKYFDIEILFSTFCIFGSLQLRKLRIKHYKQEIIFNILLQYVL